MHFILVKPVFSDHLSYVTIFQCSIGGSHKTGLTVQVLTYKDALITCSDIVDVNEVKMRFRFMVFNTTFNNISAISSRSVLLVEETRVPVENHRPVTSHCT